MSDQEMLAQARTLLLAQRYDEARRLLEQSNHPTAAQWLAKLNEKHPPTATNPPVEAVKPSSVKECPYCYAEMPLEARVCPACRRLQPLVETQKPEGSAEEALPTEDEALEPFLKIFAQADEDASTRSSGQDTAPPDVEPLQVPLADDERAQAQQQDGTHFDPDTQRQHPSEADRGNPGVRTVPVSMGSGYGALSLLATFYYLMAGLAILGGAFLAATVRAYGAPTLLYILAGLIIGISFAAVGQGINALLELVRNSRAQTQYLKQLVDKLP